MLSSESLGFAEVRLADFGLARLTRPQERQQLERLTRLLSTPAREWSSARRASERSMEAMLERMLTGRTSGWGRVAGQLGFAGWCCPGAGLYAAGA